MRRNVVVNFGNAPPCPKCGCTDFTNTHGTKKTNIEGIETIIIDEKVIHLQKYSISRYVECCACGASYRSYRLEKKMV